LEGRGVAGVFVGFCGGRFLWIGIVCLSVGRCGKNERKKER
jgi:hypothetical protein